MADINQVADQFVKYYYQTFTSNRANLVSLYDATSMLSFEGEQFQGPEAIAGKLSSLPLFKVEPQIDTMDTQMSNPSAGSILVFITGRMIIDDESNPQRFSQTFNLYPSNNSFFIFNEIFRLNYG